MGLAAALGLAAIAGAIGGFVASVLDLVRRRLANAWRVRRDEPPLRYVVRPRLERIAWLPGAITGAIVAARGPIVVGGAAALAPIALWFGVLAVASLVLAIGDAFRRAS